MCRQTSALNGERGDAAGRCTRALLAAARAPPSPAPGAPTAAQPPARRARDQTRPRPHAAPPGRYALPRPEGQRCLVVAARGGTVARTRSGALLERFRSLLPAGGPGGGQGGAGGEDCFCILDCVFHPADQTYYVLGALRCAALLHAAAMAALLHAAAMAALLQLRAVCAAAMCRVRGAARRGAMLPRRACCRRTARCTAHAVGRPHLWAPYRSPP